MAGLRLPYTVLDVFTDVPLQGNALAVVHDADRLDDATMLRFARETRLSETSFVQRPTAAGADYRNRIFTVAGEVPFAGHPSLGTAVAVAARRGEPEASFVQETGAGLQPVDVRLEGGTARASMLQGPIAFGAELDPALVMGAAGLDVRDADPALVPQLASAGLETLIAPVRGASALRRTAPVAETLAVVRRSSDPLSFYVVWCDPAAGRARARMFSSAIPGGEDPATGSAAGPLCAYLHARAGCARVEVEQGVEMGRPSLLEAEIAGDRVRVGGAVVTVVEGTVALWSEPVGDPAAEGLPAGLEPADEGTAAGRQAAAFFDLDRTLMAGASAYHFGRAMYKAGQTTRRQLARDGLEQLRFRLQGASDAAVNALLDRVREGIRGLPAEHLARLTPDVLAGVLPRIYPQMMEVVRWHQDQGRSCLIATAASHDLVEILAQVLGMEGAVGTRWEIVDGVLTGRLDGPFAYGEGKARAVRRVAVERGIDLAGSWAYTDSVSDLPMLEAVGHPVAVNPDSKLAEIARREDWEVLRFEKLGQRLQIAGAVLAAGAVGGSGSWLAVRRRNAGLARRRLGAIRRS